MTRADADAVALAERHYPRRRRARTVGPPGEVVVLRTPEGDAFWVSSRSSYDRTDGWPRAWANNHFRNESEHLSSELILEAVAVTLDAFGPAPDDGMVTHIDPTKVRRKRDPGRCFRRAGFEPVGWTAGGHGRNRLLILRLAPERMPDPAGPLELRPVLA